MEEPVYTPFEFFNLPDYLQRKIMIEELDFESVQNLCDATNEIENAKVKNFFERLCGSAGVWKDKFQHDLPRSFPRVMREALENESEEDVEYWKSAYKIYERTLRGSGEKLLYASRHGDLRKVRALLGLGSDSNFQDKAGLTALMGASRKGYPEIVEMLLAAGAEVNLRTKYGYTALIKASLGGYRGYREIVEMLLAAGADVNLRTEDEYTALMGASQFGHPETVKMLLDKGADVNLQDEGRYTALMLASRAGHAEIVEMLLDKGADVDLQDEAGTTALIRASEFGHPKIAEMLLKAGADVNLQDGDGETALMLALVTFESGSSTRDYDTIFTIIKYKPDPDIPNNAGETAISIAEGFELTSIVDTLLYLRRTRDAL